MLCRYVRWFGLILLLFLWKVLVGMLCVGKVCISFLLMFGGRVLMLKKVV